MTRLAILGASGHGKVVADAALRAGWTTIAFFDDARGKGERVGPWPILGTSADLVRDRAECDAAVVAIGDNRTRIAKQEELVAGQVRIATIAHPASVVSPFATVGEGSVLFAGSVVNPFAVLGRACIVNTGATVDHDCLLADGVHLSPGAHLGGAVRIGMCSWVGIGSAVRHGISLGAHVVVGAGAAVVENVDDGLTIVGVPARPLDKLR